MTLSDKFGKIDALRLEHQTSFTPAPSSAAPPSAGSQYTINTLNNQQQNNNGKRNADHINIKINKFPGDLIVHDGGGGPAHLPRSASASSSSTSSSSSNDNGQSCCNCGGISGSANSRRQCLSFGSGLLEDIRKRCSYYKSDFTDGIFGHRSLYKTCSTTIFLYFSVLLPCIAFGVVDTNNTNGQIDPKKTMIGQAIGGAIFAFISGQPLIVIMTTAPLCIYVKVIYEISLDLDVEFSVYYTCCAIWMSFFLVIMSVTNLSNLMKYCTRSTEDIFALFTALAFGSDGVKEAFRSFNRYYWNPECVLDGNSTAHSVFVQPQFQLNSGEHSPNQIDNNHHITSSPSSSDPSYSTSKLLINSSTTTTTTTTFASALNETLGDFLTSTISTTPAPQDNNNNNNQTSMHEFHTDHMSFPSRCQRETCILFLFLMFGTLWLANSFSSFDRTPYLSSRKREFIKDYALALSVLLFSFVGSYVFMDIHLDVFEFSEFRGVNLVNFALINARTIYSSSILGLMLALLFYIDQNICGAMVNNAPFKLKKGDYFHLDLLVLAALNLLLCMFGLPFMHGKLPHSHLHSKALADYEERVTEGHVESKIVSIRETRLTQLFCSLGIGLSLFAVPYPIAYIPLPVLSGVFLYTALAEFKSNSMVERICLIFSEVGAYPSSHYTRRVSRHKIHLFTAAQVLQLAIVSLIGFYPNPYVNMAFPLAIAFFIPFRSFILPRLIENKYLQILDEHSSAA